jgi:hypothetical protein
MITKNISWSLGATPNKSLEIPPQAAAVGVHIEPSIPINLPGDPLANQNHPRKNSVHTGVTLLAPIPPADEPLFTSAIALLIDRAQEPLTLNNDNHLRSFSIAPDRSDRFLNFDRSLALTLTLTLTLNPNLNPNLNLFPGFRFAHCRSLTTNH